MQEGICKNCGSIIFVDPKKEKAHCLFCNCVFPTTEALEIAKDKSAYSFPNEEQPEVVDQEIEARYDKQIKSLKKLEESQKRNKAKAQAKNKPQYAVKTKELPDVNLSTKQIITLVTGFLVLALVFLGIMLPQTIKRDNHREEITARFKEDMTSSELKAAIDFDEGFVISEMNNSHLDLIIREELSVEEAIKIFELYSDTRAAVIGDVADEEKYKQVSLKIAVPEEGGYLIKDQDIADLEDHTNVIELP